MSIGHGNGVEERDCVVPIGEDEWVRGFIRLPSDSATGRLRLVDEVPGIEIRNELTEPLFFIIQDSGTGTPGFVIDGFVVRHGISMPVPAAFPLEVSINKALVGVEDADVKFGKASVASTDLLDFFGSAEINQEDAATHQSIDRRRIVASYGSRGLEVAETTSRTVDGTRLTVDWSGRISLSGDPLLLSDWADPLFQVLGFFSFCIDRPLIPERLFATGNGADVELHVGWREAAAPLSTAPLVTERTLETPVSALVDGWSELWEESPHLMQHVAAFQLRRDNLTLDDKLLVLVRTLELFHARAERMKSSIRTKVEHKRFRDAVVASLPDELAGSAEWIKKSLNESNRKRLAAQIEDIVVDLGPEVISACGISGTAKEFGGVVAATRNQFTHPKKKVPKKVPEGRELLVLIHRLWFLVRAAIMDEIGMANREVVQALEGSSTKHYIVGG